MSSMGVLFITSCDGRHAALRRHLKPAGVKAMIMFLGWVCWSGCVPKVQHDQTLASYEEGQRSLKTLQRDHQRCTDEKAVLSQQVTQLSERNEDLVEARDTLLARNRECTEQTLNQLSKQSKNANTDDVVRAQEQQLGRIYLKLLDVMAQPMARNAVRVKREGASVALTLLEQDLFDATTVHAGGQAMLGNLAPVLAVSEGLTVAVHHYGGGSAVKTEPDVLEQSALKAVRVVQVFKAVGFSKVRLWPIGHGESNKASEQRRLEIVWMP